MDTFTYRLQGRVPIPAPDRDAWGRWWQAADRTVAQTPITADCKVLTTFLGLHDPPDPVPLLFVSLVMGGPLHGQRVKTATWEAAEQAHQALVARVRGETTR